MEMGGDNLFEGVVEKLNVIDVYSNNVVVRVGEYEVVNCWWLD